MTGGETFWKDRRERDYLGRWRKDKLIIELGLKRNFIIFFFSFLSVLFLIEKEKYVIAKGASPKLWQSETITFLNNTKVFYDTEF